MKITKQGVQAVSDLKAGYTLGHADVAILNELARIALASLEADRKLSDFVASQESLGGDFEKVLAENIEDLYLSGYTAPPAPVSVPGNSAITQYFDTIALEAAREIMCDVNRRHEFIGGDVQLLSRIQCRIDDACRAAMLQGAEPVSNRDELPVWVACSERMPDPDSEFRICAYTPTPHEDVRFRFVPASLFKSICRDATHWQYMLPPAAPQQEV